ncbi:MAG: hypothetical protein Q8K82_15565 [Gemmatimonadaceae bacterium]|nr:hypothetical protein [Gemmatimonadaceae bacterium]
MKVRLIAAHLESLPATHFVLLVATVGGVLRSVPGYLAGRTAAGALFTVALISAATILLWWVAVRRRQFSVWRVAWHLVVALALADLFAFGITLALVSIDAQGKLARDLAHMPLSTFLGAFVPPIPILGAVRFVIASVLIGVGRHLPGSGKVVNRHSLAPTHPGAVT